MKFGVLKQVEEVKVQGRTRSLFLMTTISQKEIQAVEMTKGQKLKMQKHNMFITR